MIGTPIRGFMKSLLNAIEEKKQVAYRKGKTYQPDRKQVGKKLRKSDHINRRTGDNGISAIAIKTEYQISVRDNLSDKGEEKDYLRMEILQSVEKKNWNRHFRD